MASSPASAPPPDRKSPIPDPSSPANSTSHPSPDSSSPSPHSAPSPLPLPPPSPPPSSTPPPFSPPPQPSPPPPTSPSPPPTSPPPPLPKLSPPAPQDSSPPVSQESPPPPPIFFPPPSLKVSSPPSPTLPPPSPSSPTPASPTPTSPTPTSPIKPAPSSGDFLPPPPPNQQTKSPSSHTSPPTDGEDANSNMSLGGAHTYLPMVAGIVAGIALFILIFSIVACIFCRRKKKKPHNSTHYYPNRGAKGGDYYINGPSQSKLHKGGQDVPIRIPPPPGMAWQASPTPSTIHGEASTNQSGTNGSQQKSSSPSITLGFVKSTFSYEELSEATSGFSKENLLGQGGFGYVYKGVFPNGKEVAVKQLKAGSGQGEREFQAEVEIISRVHHRHLVSLVGYCILGSQRLLVYDFVPNKTLEFHLHGKGQPTMDWPTRMRIALGSAKGLAYLHEDCHPRIIHRDIKAANILLDYRFEAMVADFGLAKLTSDNYTHVSTRVMGTFGYLAPEYASSGKLSDKSDVFSFGVMLLELITGKKPVDNNPNVDSLVDWARPLMAQALSDENYEELADPRLEGNYDKIEMAQMVACAATSVRHSAKRRPKMSQIVRALEGDSSFEDLAEGMKPGQSMLFTSSSDYDSGSYASNMSRFRRATMESNEFSQGYSVQTSDYGLNPSSSSSSGEITSGVASHSQQSSYQ